MTCNGNIFNMIQPTNCEGDTREEYMIKLRKWCAEATQHNMQMLALWQSHYIQMQQSSQTPNAPTETQSARAPTDTATHIGRHRIYSIPPMWKRGLAEAIDFTILFTIKMFLTVLFIENFDLLDFENYTLSALEEQLQNPSIATKLTAEIFILEILHRIIVCFYEACWIAAEGATPGKRIMGLIVVNTDIVIQINGDAERVIIDPGTRLTFRNALLRAVLKNVCVGLLFPICFVLLFFKYNRTGYDLASSSIVLERSVDLPPNQQR